MTRARTKRSAAIAGAIAAGLAVLLVMLAAGKPTLSDADCGRFVERSGESFSSEPAVWPPGETCWLTSASGTVERHVGFETTDWLIVLAVALLGAACAYVLVLFAPSRTRRTGRRQG